MTSFGKKTFQNNVILFILFFFYIRLKATLTVVPFKKLDFGETAALETFYNADVVIVDISTRIIQALAYHVGVRHSMGMKHNIIISCETDPEITSPFKVSKLDSGILQISGSKSGQYDPSRKPTHHYVIPEVSVK